jgi:hypothetical protein
MEETLGLKFNQHPDLREELLGTGDAELIEVYLIIINIMRQALIRGTVRILTKMLSGE